MHVVSPVHVAEGQTDPVIANESTIQHPVDTIPFTAEFCISIPYIFASVQDFS